MSDTLLCLLGDIEDGGAIEVEHQGDSLVVLRFGALAQAYRNVCPHTGRPLNWAPGRFLIAQSQLVCAAHGAAFALGTGACLGGPCRGEGLQVFQVRVVGDRVEADAAT